MTTVRAPQEPTVFVVQGDPTLRASMTGLLRKAGHAVQGFASPLAFLAAARSLGPGCVVIDSQLPELGISESERIDRAEAKRKLGVTSAAELTSLFARLGGIAVGGA